jgi:hypothetical protein
MNNKSGKTNTVAVIAMVAGITLLAVVTISTLQSNRSSRIATSPVNTSAQAAPTDDGSDIVTEEGALVEDFPPFPSYPGAKIIKSSQISFREKEGFSADWTTSASLASVMNFYEDAGKKNNWQLLSEAPDMTKFEQQLEFLIDGRKVTVTAERDQESNVTEIEISFIPQ